MQRLVSNEEEDATEVLLCLCPTDQIEDFQKELAGLNDGIVYHTDVDVCMRFVQPNAQKTKMLLIISHQYIADLLSHRQTFSTIDSIFIYCSKEDEFRYVYDDELNIIGVYDRIDRLRSSVEKQVDSIHQQSYRWAVYDQEDYLSRDLSKQAFDFLWIHLFRQVIGHFPHDEEAREQLMAFLRLSAQEGPLHLEEVDELAEKYQSTDVLRWYFNSSFLRSAISKALQSQDMDQLYSLRYLLADMVEDLVSRSSEENFIAYRTMKLSPSELNHLKQNQGKLISYKGFLCAACTNSSPAQCTDLLAVRFDIDCHLRELGVANVTEWTGNEGVLFDLDATFRLESIQQSEQVCRVRLTAVDDGVKIAEKYLADTRRQLENCSVRILFGKLMFDLCRWDQALRYFQHVRNDDLAWVEQSIGNILYWKGAWDEARKFYDRAYERMITGDPPRLTDSAVVLADIGEVLNAQGKCDEALDFYQRALAIREQSYPADHPLIANSLDNLGFLYREWQKTNQALDFYQRALAIRETYYHSNHVDIAQSLVHTSYKFMVRGQHQQALDGLQRALSIYTKSYQSVHMNIAYALHYMANDFDTQGKFRECFETNQQVLAMVKKIRSSNHPDIGRVLINIGFTRHEEGISDQCLELYHLALSKFRQCLPSDHVDVGWALNRLGYIQLSGKKNYDQALYFYQQALGIFEQSHSFNVFYGGNALNGIGTTLADQGKHDQALDSYRRALKMLEEFYSADDMALTSTLTNIGHVLAAQGKLDEALLHHQRALEITRQTSPSKQLQIADALGNVAGVLHTQGSYEQALDLYQQAVAIKEDFYSPDHICIAAHLNSIGCVLYLLGRYDEAEKCHQEALTIQEKHNPSTDHIDMACSFNNLGNVFYSRNQLDDALQFYRRASNIQEQLDPSNYKLIDIFLGNMSGALMRQKNFEEVIECEQRLLNIRQAHKPFTDEELAGKYQQMAAVRSYQAKYNEERLLYEQALTIYENSTPSNRTKIVLCLSKIASILGDQGQYAQALEHRERILALNRENYSTDGPRIADSLTDIAHILYEQKQFAECLDMYQQAMQIYERWLYEEDMALCLLRMSAVRHQQEDHHQALQLQFKALTIFEVDPPSDHRKLDTCLDVVCNSFNALGDPEQVLAVRQDAYSSDRINMGTSLVCVGRMSHMQDKLEKALSIYEQAVGIYERFAPPDHLSTAVCLRHMGHVMNDQSRSDEALAFYDRALTIRGKHYPDSHALIVESLRDIGHAYFYRGELNEAIDHYHQALVLVKERDPGNGPMIISCAESIENCRNEERQIRLQNEQHDLSSDLHCHIQCYMIREQVLPPDDFDIGERLSNIAVCYEDMDEPKKGLEYYQRALSAYEQCPYRSPSQISVMKMNIHRVLTKIEEEGKLNAPLL